VLDQEQIDRCYERAGAQRFRISREEFAASLEAGLERAFKGETPDRQAVSRYLDHLHLEDLALACACASGESEAWEHFVRTYRPALYRAAQAIDRSGGARDLADSLWADLYATEGAGAERRSLFRYFHGRSSLATWLRAVLSQRYIDLVRERRRTEPLPDDEVAAPMTVAAPDPERTRFIALMGVALTNAVARLSADDRLRLTCYYDRRMTLAQIGRLSGEHEATVSRHLARTRSSIRTAVESELRGVHGLTETAIAECIQAVTGDPGPLDLEQLLRGKKLDEDRSRDEGCV
jgi:RNA polymerase sigma-70 factor